MANIAPDIPIVKGDDVPLRPVACNGLTDRQPLPCLSSNNCTEGIDKGLEIQQAERIGRVYQRGGEENDPREVYLPNGELLESVKRVYQRTEEDIGKRLLKGYQKKAAHVLNLNVKQFLEKHGQDNVGFLTMTYPKGVKCPKKASAIFHSCATHFLKKVFPDYIAVMEPHKDGRPHLHLLVSTQQDIRGNFDFKAFMECQEEYSKKGDTAKFQRLRRKYSKTAPAALRNMWKLLRSELRKYGFGRSELLPIREGGEAMGRYVGKYLCKASVIREDVGWKGVRLTRYSKGSKSHNGNFMWMCDGSDLWRSKVKTWANWVGITSGDIDDLTRVLGDRWAFNFREAIESTIPESFVHYLAIIGTWNFDTGTTYEKDGKLYDVAYRWDDQKEKTIVVLRPVGVKPPEREEDYYPTKGEIYGEEYDGRDLNQVPKEVLRHYLAKRLRKKNLLHRTHVQECLNFVNLPDMADLLDDLDKKPKATKEEIQKAWSDLEGMNI
jgi:hypothetical protein